MTILNYKKISLNTKLKFISVLIPLFSFFICFLVTSPHFLTNDDSGIQDTLAGCVTGKPYPYHQFINCFLGFMICAFYRIFPSCPWWWITEIFICIMGSAFFNYCLLNIFFTHKNKQNFSLVIFFIVVIDFLIFIYNTILVSFTVSPALFYSGAILLLFLYGNINKKESIKIPIFIGIIILFCSLVRFESGLVGVCFYFLGLFYYSIKLNKNKSIKFFLKVSICFLIISSLTFSLNYISNKIQDSKNPDEFRSFNNARALYMGYPHISYEDNPQFFEDIGFYSEKFDLVTSWCFLDPDVTETFFSTAFNAKKIDNTKNENILIENSDLEITQTLCENNKRSFVERLKKITPKKLLRWSYRFFKTKVENYEKYREVFCVFSILYSFIPLIILIKKKIISIDFIFSLLTVIGMWGLICYLKFKGRTVNRALLTCIIPMLFINSFLLIQTFISSKTITKIKVFYFMELFLVLYSFFGVIFAFELVKRKEENSNDVRSVIKYIKNTNDIYIYDFSFSSDMPFTNMPINLIPWGGSCWKSDLENQRQYILLNVYPLNFEIFKNEKVFFISKKNENFRNLYTVLSKDYGCIDYTHKEINTNVTVYKFILETK